MENPIHRGRCADDVAWSTINAGEAIPGVVTPLTWSFFGDATERAMKHTFCDLGVLDPSQVVASPRAEERLWDVFFGRAAGNLNTFRWLGDRMPGTSGDAIEEQIFGQVRPGVRSKSVYGRYPVVAAKMPLAAVRLVGRLERVVAPINPWWQQAVRPGALDGADAARAALSEAAARFEAVMRPHTLAAMLCQGMYEQLRRAAEAAGRPGLELSLITGYGQMAETAFVSDLWEVSRGRLTLDEFVVRHGYHGPDEGELSARVWRIRRDPLHDVLRAYREMGDDRDPRSVERERAAERARAELELFSALPPHRRAAAKLVARIAAQFIPLRGTGKAAFLQCVDVARAAARMIGEELARDGRLGEPEEVFMLTVPELVAPGPLLNARELATERRAVHEEYRKLDIPDMFYGVPAPFAKSERRDRSGEGVVTGAPVSRGVVEGVARVVLDPQSDDPLEPGEILVCRTTDPSWASTMMLASALVIDIGGPISHGAIVARELGIPCVTGTRDGTAQIRTGDRVRVDGAKGEARVIERCGPESVGPEGTEFSIENDAVRGGVMDNNELLVLMALRLKGRGSTEELVATTGLEGWAVAAVVDPLVESGGARELRGSYMLTAPARERLKELLDSERAGVDSAAVRDSYEEFTSVNQDFKQLATDWQLRDEQPNDHSDPAYDAEVVERLPSIHARVAPILERVVELVPRLAPYQARLSTALARVQGGDHTWLLKPLIDSYHTVWFELHEELISLAGLSREAEAVSGRAE
jgi:pyruvate,water dikinase